MNLPQLVEDLQDLDIYLVDENPEVVKALEAAFSDPRLPELAREKNYDLRIHVHQGSIFDYPAHVIVSPANSSGDMHGGIDAQYLQRFPGIEEKVIEQIDKRHGGFLTPGKTVIVKIPQGTTVPWKYLISSPTMFMPGQLVEPIPAFIAFKAVLETLSEFNRTFPKSPILSFSCPGLGTGIGEMNPFRSAMQMRAALDSFLGKGFSSRDYQEKRKYYVAIATYSAPFDVKKFYEP